MTTTTVQILVQYTRNLYARALVRPYRNRLPLANGVSGHLLVERLPEDHHWLVVLGMDVTATNTEGVKCFETGCEVEAVVVATGLTEEEVREHLSTNIAGLLLGNIRAALTTASLNTGYGPVVLPPITADRLAGLLSKAQPAETEKDAQ